MHVIDLFSGCGGLSLGFCEEGFDVKLGIDIDSAAIDTFNKNHPDSIGIVGDITKLSKKDIAYQSNTKKIDLIVGGPPCQGMSLSGPRQYDDPRNQLYLSFLRLIEELKPKAVVFENVPGMVSLYKGAIHRAVLKSFDDLGYTINHQILKASDYGVPQHRRRVIYVAIQGKKFVYPEPTHVDPTGERLLSGPNLDMVTCEEAICDLPLLENELGEDPQEYEVEPSNKYQKLMRNGSKKISNHIAAKHSEQVRETIKLVPPGKNYKSLPEELRHTRKFNVAWTRFPDSSPAPTIDTGHRHHFHYKANRVPTVRECARLQSFPDKFIFCGNKTQQFRQVGNAVPPLLAQTIAKSLKEQL